jgi:uncharacterized protein (TIGR02680 family)
MTLIAETAQATAEPQPHILRWQPLRLGLIDLFQYENEEFPFRDGRLLLRGNNGAGKSKVLALTLPFLLDGDISSRRVEPDADPAKRMEWNLLLGGDYPNTERVGYSWLEFGRRDEDGVAHFLTIGAGLKAASGRGITKTWFFITQRRIRHELSLIDEHRVVLGKDRLAAAIEDTGRVYDTKREYRHALDDKLFGLGERRYDALIDLLIQIRAPQLSKRPSEKLLSDALTESLTPVRRDLIEFVAEGMRGLDEERDQLQQLTDAHRSVLAFLGHYRAYAKVLVKRQAEGPRRNQSEHDRLGRQIIDLTDQAADVAAALAAASDELTVLQRQHAEREAEDEALRDSEFVELEAQLRSADDAASTADARVKRAEAVREKAAAALAEAEASATAEGARTDQSRARHAEALAAAQTAAANAHVAEEHAIVFGAVPADREDALAAAPEPDNTEADDAAQDVRRQALLRADRDSTRGRIQDARESLETVAQLLTALATADADLRQARQRQDAAETALATARAAREAADAECEREADRYVADIEAALAALTELTVTEADFDAVAEWAHSSAGENPLRVALADAADTVRTEVLGLRVQADARRTELVGQREALDSEIAGLERGESAEPPRQYTRTPEVPAMAGLPLWRAVSFRDHVDRAQRAGLEAALEASGMLTALILPDGELRDPASGEVILHGNADSDGATLRDLLRVELPDGAPLTGAAVDAVLGGVRLRPREGDDVPVWVSAAGEFRLGPARGAWSKPAAGYIGESARADARRRRLEAARLEHAHLSELVATAETEIAALNQRLATVAAEQRSLPHPTALDNARHATSVAAALAATAEENGQAAIAAVATAEATHGERARELATDAELLGLSTEPASIAALTAALVDYERLAGEFWHAAETLLASERVLREAERRRSGRREAAEAAEVEREEAVTDAAARTAYAASLRDSVGEDVAQYRQRVAEVKSALQAIKHETARARHAREEAGKREAVLGEKLREAHEKQDAVAAARVASVAVLRKTTALGLVRVALPDLDQPDFDQGSDWSVTQGVQLARAIDQELSELDASDARFDRVLAQVHTEFTTLQVALGRYGHQAVSVPHEDGYQVLVVFAGREASLAELADYLGADIEARERLLGAREREIIENHLVTEVGAHLSELVGEADRQIADINTELDQRPTSTGMKLRVRWRPRPDGPAGLADARARLGKVADAWDEDDRAALGAFLQGRIAEVRESDESGNWYDHLGDALDYRRWHHFVIERYQGGTWKSATGPASGGERVLAASIPLFAAASSHYRTAANPFAPRLVMLDEAFAGVDDNARASCLGLLAAFDLDVVMTSEREWGCYAEVPGLSIAQLSRFEDTPAVLVQLWSWDGKHKARVITPSADEPADAMW